LRYVRGSRASDANLLLFCHGAEKRDASVRKPNGFARSGGVSLSRQWPDIYRGQS